MAEDIYYYDAATCNKVHNMPVLGTGTSTRGPMPFDGILDPDASNTTNERKLTSLFGTKGFKRSMFCLILLTVLSIIYSFVNKLGDEQFKILFQNLFSKMEEMSQNTSMRIE